MVLYSLWCWLNNCCSKEDSLSKKTLSENPTTPTSMPYYSDPTAAAYGAPPLTSTNDAIENPTTPRSMPYYSDPTAAAYGTSPLTSTNDAIDRSNRSKNNRKNTAVRDISNTRDVKLGTVGDITDAGDVKVTTVRDIINARDVKIGSNKQTTFNEHTTNFIVCFSDSSKPMVM
uniref:Uncharacterized protein n=1 Tax=Panagrolaimus sp. PS1159 TaxID=55785 RepID=A0AC35GI44_9BILA